MTSTTTYTDDYDDVEVIVLYVDGADVDREDVMTDYGYDDDYYNTNAYTSYLMPLDMTAPESCPTPFTYHTFTEVSIPTAVLSAGLISPVSYETSYATYDRDETYTYVSAYLSSDAISMTEPLSENYIYTYYVEYCTDPAEYFGEYTTTTEEFGSDPTDGFFGDDNDDFESQNTRGRFGIDECDALMHCGWLTTALIIIAAILPAIFLLGFVESYFWFRRLMTGKSAFRLGTFCWMFLFLPVICLTRRTPARDIDSQAQLREHWKNTSWGTGLGLWFKYGFRHKYPEILGEHPEYKNDFPVAPKEVDMQQPIGYGPPPSNMAPAQPPMVYYMPTTAGQPGAGPTQVAAMPPPHGGAPYYPQYPPQAVYAAAGPPPQQRERGPKPSRVRGSRGAPPVSTVSSPSPVSEVAEPATTERAVSPPPSEPTTAPPPPPTNAEAGPSGQTRD